MESLNTVSKLWQTSSCDINLENTILSLKPVKETSLNGYIQKSKHMSIVCHVPSNVKLENWKTSVPKTRILYLCLPLLYFVSSFDVIRFAWFIVANISTMGGGMIFAKCLVMFIKFFSVTNALIVIWKRNDINNLIQEYQDYIPVCQNGGFLDKYYQFGTRTLISFACSSVLLGLVFQVICPAIFRDSVYLLDVLTFPVSGDSNLYLLMLTIGFLIYISCVFIFLPLVTVVDTFESFFIDEYNYLSKVFKDFIQGHQCRWKNIFPENENRSQILIGLINKHTKICQLLTITNDVFQFATPLMIFLYMINIYAIVYELSNELVPTKSYIFQIVPGGMSAIFCVYRFYKGIKINISVSIS